MITHNGKRDKKQYHFVFDIIFGIFAAAANQLLLEMDLTLQASRIGLLDGRMQKK